MDRFLLKVILVEEFPWKQNFEKNPKKVFQNTIIQFLIELEP